MGRTDLHPHPLARVGNPAALPANPWSLPVPHDRRFHLRFNCETATSRAVLAVDGVPVAQVSVSLNALRSAPFLLSLGRFGGDLDEILVFQDQFHPIPDESMDTPSPSCFPSGYTLRA